MADLTDEQRAILDLERSWWKHPGAKDAAIREQFDISPTRYYAMLNGLIDRPEALAADPMVVRRLLRLRELRRDARSDRRTAPKVLPQGCISAPSERADR